MNYSVDLIIPTTGDPEIVEPLFESIVRNTCGPYSVLVLKQEIAHPDADKTYQKWKYKYPSWRFIQGTERMSLSARNIGLMESYVEQCPEGYEQWFAEMDDDVILPPRWDEDMVKAAQAIGEGEIFVPLLTFWGPLYYRKQLAILPPEIWKAMFDGDIDKLNDFYSDSFRVEEPVFQPCPGPELCFLMRRHRSLIPLLWDTAFDIQRHMAYANKELMLRLEKHKWSAWIVQSVLVFHRGFGTRRRHPKQGYAGPTLRQYLFQKWPECDMEKPKDVMMSRGGLDKQEDARRNMPKGLPQGAAPCFTPQEEKK